MGVGHFSRELMMMIVSKLYKRFLWKKNMLKKSKKPKMLPMALQLEKLKCRSLHPGAHCSPNGRCMGLACSSWTAGGGW